MIVILLSLIQSFLGATQQSLHPCAAKTGDIVVGLSTNETHQWDFKQLFSGSYLTYELSKDDSYFFIQSPIYQYTKPLPLKESVSKITGIAALQESTQRVWLNHFAYLSKQIGITKLFYAESSQGSYANPPNFNQVILISQNNSVTCPGLEYITKDTFILDCFDNSQTYLQNTFIIVQKNGTLKQYYNENYNDYITTTKRINQVVTFKYNNGTQQQYLFRSTPAYATERKFDISSIIEVFKLNDTQAPQRVALLTSYNIAVLIGDPTPFEYEFSLIDFEVSLTGTLYILTAFQGVLIFTMDEYYQFTFVIQLLPTSLQAYEFDTDWILRDDGSYTEVIAILYQTTVYVYRSRLLINEYDLDLIASYPAYLSISQEFIITQIKGLTQLFNTETQDAIYKESIEGLMAFLINPFYTEMIAITQIYSKRFQITNGYLTFQKTLVTTSTKKQLLITAIDGFSNKCNVSLIYKIMDSTDYSVQTLREAEFQNLEYDQPPERVFNQPASGPNIQYQYISSTIGSVIIRQGKTVLLDSQPENEVFFKIQSLNKEDSNVGMIHQDNYKIVRTQVCKVSYEPEVSPFECRSYSNYQESVFLNENNFAWFNSATAFYTVTVSADQYSAQLYMITVNEVVLSAKLIYTNDTVNKIKSVSILSSNIYLTLSNKRVIDIWNYFTKLKVLSITESLMRTLGMIGNWSPQKIYGNHVHHASLLFIINEDNVVILDFHKEVTLIKEIYVGSGEISVSIGKSSFAILYKGANSEFLEEYDLTYLGFIRQIKSFPLYFYSIQSPLKSSFSLGSGSFYVLAYDIKETQGYVVLAYQLGSTLRDSLFKVFPQQTNQISLSATGFSHDILYFKTNVSGIYKHEVFASFHTYYYQIIPNYPSQDQIIFNNQIKIQAYNNVKKEQSQFFQSTITQINTMTQLYVNQSILNEKTLKVTNRSQYEIQFDNDWISGFTGSHVLDCGQCAEKIQMLDIFNEINVWDDPTLNIIHSGPFTYTNDIQNPEYQVLLSVTTNLSCIIIVNNTGNVVKRINLKPYSNGFTYDKVANTRVQAAPQQFIFVSGFNQNDGLRYIQSIQCKTIENCGNVTFWNSMNQKYLKEFYKYKDFLYALESHPTDPTAYTSQLVIYSFTVTDSSGTIYWRYNLTIAGQSLFSFLIWDTFIDNYYYLQIILFSIQGQAQSVSAWQDAATTLYFYNTYSQKFSQEIINQGFAPVNKFTDLIMINKIYNATLKNLELKLSLLGEFNPHTTLTFLFNYTYWGNVNFLSTTINQQLNGHYQAQYISGATKYKDSYLIPYFDGKNLILSYYKVQENKKVIFSYGGLIVPNNTKNKTSIICLLVNNNIALTNIQENNDKTYYLSTLYRLVDAFTFSVNNSAGEIYSQNITLTLKNELGEATANIKLVREEDQIVESNQFLGKLKTYFRDFF